MRTHVLIAWVMATIAGGGMPSAEAQPPAPANPLAAAIRIQYEGVRRFLLKAADQASDEDFAFRPTPDVRSFGAIIGHVADSNFSFCSAAVGESSPVTGIEKTKTSKADLVRALADSFAYCDKVHASMTDARGLETITLFRDHQPRIAVLAFNTSHDYEHYGNLVTYLRLRGKVPPSTPQ